MNSQDKSIIIYKGLTLIFGLTTLLAFGYIGYYELLSTTNILLGFFGVVGIPIVVSVVFALLDRIGFINITEIIDKSTKKSIESRDVIFEDKFKQELKELLSSNLVNDQFINETKKLGSIYFTGVARQHNVTSLFGRLNEPPKDFERPGIRNRQSKLLFIGIGTDLIPNFVLDDMEKHSRLVYSEDVADSDKCHYRLLYNNTEAISKFRTQSILDYKKEWGDYQKINIDMLSILKEKLENYQDKGKVPYDIFQFRQHDVYPMGVMIAHGNYVWYSPLWNHTDSRSETVVLEIYRDSAFGQVLEGSFDVIWDSSK